MIAVLTPCLFFAILVGALDCISKSMHENTVFRKQPVTLHHVFSNSHCIFSSQGQMANMFFSKCKLSNMVI